MSTIRRYGPSLGAGTVILEKPPEPAIIPSPFGATAWAAILEKGPTDKLIDTLSKTDFTRQTGGRLPESYAPDCGEDFWKAGQGAGRLFLIRVTDGTGRKATMNFKSRETASVGVGRWRDVLTTDALSVGRWAGGFNRVIGEIVDSGDLTETTIDTGLTLLEDEFAGGTLFMTELPAKSWKIVGNTTAGLVTIYPDSTLLADYGSGTENEFVLWKDDTDVFGNNKNVAVLLKDGARDPVAEWGVEIYWNDQLVVDQPDLSSDPDSDRYYLDVINKLASNYEAFLTDLFTGQITSNIRPANQFGTIPTGGLASLVLTIEVLQTYNDVANTGDGVAGTFVYGTALQRDFLTLECTDATIPGSEVWSVTSTTQDRTFADATTAVPYVNVNEYTIGFTITAGIGWAVADKIYVAVEPLVEDEAIGGKVFYDYGVDPRAYLEIVDNDETTVTVRAGNDLSTLTAEGKLYRLEYRQKLWRGYDGHAGVADSDYEQAFDPSSCLFNRFKDRRLGLIKYAVPGVETVAVQTAMRSYAAGKNGAPRVSIPAANDTEQAAVAYVEDTLGRNDFQSVIFPSWYDKSNPDGAGLKRIPLTGAVQGLEALYARTYQGYHKAAAGTAAILDMVRDLPTEDRDLDQEVLNPKGIQMCLKKEGNFVVWGDKIPSTSGAIFWKHKREQLSHYERVLQENFDWIIFAINDEEEQPNLLSALRGFFLPEWRPKRALRGKTLNEAAAIKLDSENNTDPTRAAGEMHAEITLQFVDTVEKFIITVGQAGIFESVSG